MFLELWMIGLMMGVFAGGMIHLYYHGYDRGFVEGGAYGTVNVLNIVSKELGSTQLDTIINGLKEQSEGEEE